LTTQAIESALESVGDREWQLTLAKWGRPTTSREDGSQRRRLLYAPQLAGLLIQLSTASPHIKEVFERYRGADGCVGEEEWLAFLLVEQTADDNGKSTVEDTECCAVKCPAAI
jgi:hypothetical protein